MPRLLKPTLIASASLLFLSTAAFAAPKADLNQDNQIDRAEFIMAASSKFDATDTNFDGILTKDEMKAYRDVERSERRNREFTKLDTDQNGVISKAEFEARDADRDAKRAEMRLKRFDLDNDGVISDAEKDTAKTRFAERKSQRLSDGGPREKGRKGPGKREDRIKRDADGDGLITRLEFDTATEAMFDKLDANGDGVLTKGEGKQRRHKGRKGPKGSEQ